MKIAFVSGFSSIAFFHSLKLIWLTISVFLSSSGIKNTGDAPERISPLITDLWTFLGRRILSFAFKTVKSITKFPLVEPFIKNLQ